jgi:hypothetical protein
MNVAGGLVYVRGTNGAILRLSTPPNLLRLATVDQGPFLVTGLKKETTVTTKMETVLCPRK